MLAAEASRTRETAATSTGWWIFRQDEPATPSQVVGALAEAPAEWEGSGPVRVTATHLVFEGERPRRTSLKTVTGAVRAGTSVWVQRRRAHDWLVECRTDAEAEALVDALG
ncbi:hypothetical protein [Rubrivirga sp.]|uniref:hypothetical protein n=1 Tax=Rubrivirga sp. TaxID=1885344 RepID=UPI003B529365